MMYIEFDVKIQVMAQGLPWADMDSMPPLHSYDHARQWLKDNNCEALRKKHGLSFRIVPKEFPCEFIARLEKNGVLKGGAQHPTSGGVL